MIHVSPQCEGGYTRGEDAAAAQRRGRMACAVGCGRLDSLAVEQLLRSVYFAIRW